MTTKNRLVSQDGGERSPKDIVECCAWANARLKPEQAALFYYAIENGRLVHRPVERPIGGGDA